MLDHRQSPSINRYRHRDKPQPLTSQDQNAISSPGKDYNTVIGNNITWISQRWVGVYHIWLSTRPKHLSLLTHWRCHSFALCLITWWVMSVSILYQWLSARLWWSSYRMTLESTFPPCTSNLWLLHKSESGFSSYWIGSIQTALIMLDHRQPPSIKHYRHWDKPQPLISWDQNAISCLGEGS